MPTTQLQRQSTIALLLPRRHSTFAHQQLAVAYEQAVYEISRRGMGYWKFSVIVPQKTQVTVRRVRPAPGRRKRRKR
jgi:hypothetical protein